MQQVEDAALVAARNYVPEPYKGSVRYIFGLNNEVNIPLFKTLKRIDSGSMVIRSVPGSHKTLFTSPFIQYVGSEVQSWLEEVSNGT